MKIADDLLSHRYRSRFIKNVLKWNFDFYFRKKYFPLISAFRLTNKCNLACQMCGIWRMPEKKVFDFSKFRKIINELAKMGCCYVTLSGGEPLIIPNITDYVLEGKKKKMFVNLVTNGLLLSPEMAKRFSEIELDTISISIDGFKDTHDIIRGKEGSFESTMRAIETMKEFAPNVKIVVNTVISPLNINELIEFCDFLSRKDVFVKFQPVYDHPVFSDQEKMPGKLHINKEFIATLEKVIQYLLKRKNVINSRYFLALIPRYFSQQLPAMIFNGECYTGYYYCEFMEDGFMFPCLEGMGWGKGIDIAGKNLSSFIESDNYKEELKKLERCRRCREIFTICYGEPKFLLPFHNLIYTITYLWRRN